MTDRPSWMRCTASTDPHFTVGVAYEVHSYDSEGNALIVTDFDRVMRRLPVGGAEFVAHDPWGRTT